MAHHLEPKRLRPGPRLKDSRGNRQQRHRHAKSRACGREGHHQRRCAPLLLTTKALASAESRLKNTCDRRLECSKKRQRGYTVEDDRPYVVESPTRIRLGPDAKHWAHEHGMTLEEFAKYLLHQHRHHHGEGDFESVETPEVSVNVNFTDGELHVKHPSWSIGHPNLHPSENIVLPNMHSEGR